MLTTENTLGKYSTPSDWYSKKTCVVYDDGVVLNKGPRSIIISLCYTSYIVQIGYMIGAGMDGTAYVRTGTISDNSWTEWIKQIKSNDTASQYSDGLMTAADKKKLDGIETGATKTTVENALTSTSTTNALSAAQGKALNEKFASYLPLSGGIMTAPIQSNLNTNTYLKGNQGTAIINSTVTGGKYVALANLKSTNGVFTVASYQDKLLIQWTDNTKIDNAENSVSKTITFKEDGSVTFPNGKLTTNDFTTELLNKLNGIAEGATKNTIDSAISSSSTNAVQNKVIYSRAKYMQFGVRETFTTNDYFLLIPLRYSGGIITTTGKITIFGGSTTRNNLLSTTVENTTLIPSSSVYIGEPYLCRPISTSQVYSTNNGGYDWAFIRLGT
ncbi:MAG: hypothetical protein J1G30_04290 [Spirochaetales bacterium]|nr:hypothetical protein [Spirochaetales bacterium]